METITLTLDTRLAESIIGVLGEILDGDYAGSNDVAELYDQLVKEMDY